MDMDDLIRIRNTPHLPVGLTDDLLPDFTEILNRIPDGWGRWISCDPGWYPLIAELNRKLRRLDPDYEVHQVKEKFGGLRYYFSSKTIDNETMWGIEREYEALSYTICELCSCEGSLHSSGGWLKTLCTNCASETGYKPKELKSV